MAPKPSPATHLPLRCETTGDTYWYASPIDIAAANGHYDLVRELLRLDSDHLASLTSLPNIRRLESLWDDAGEFRSAAESRSSVARRLLRECGTTSQSSGSGSNPLIASGCGGWLLYTAASAGDLGFVGELLALRPLLVFGEGEYGLTDMLYAAARSKSAEVFWKLYDFAVRPRFERAEEDESAAAAAGEVPFGFRKEVDDRAVLAAARGGSLEVLTDLLRGECDGDGDGDGVLSYRDSVGSTVLHAAAASGQVEVVKYLITTYSDIISSTNNEGNTALHMAAYKGQLAIVELLLDASPTSVSSTTEAGNTILHLAVAGALSPNFERLDRHIQLINQLTQTPNQFRVEEIINSKNNEGRTALHTAIIGNVHSDLVKHLMEARYLNVNVRDEHGMTPLDYLKQQPRSSSSELLIRQLILAGGLSNWQDTSKRNAILSMQDQDAICSSSPGTSFRVSDLEIFEHLGIERVFSSGSSIDQREVICRLLSSSSEMSVSGSNHGEEESKKRGGRLKNVAKRFKSLFRLLSMKKKRMDDDDDGYGESLKRRGSSFKESPVSLREICNKRTLSLRSNASSPNYNKKFASGVVQGVMVDRPHGSGQHASLSPSSPSMSSVSSCESPDRKGKESDDTAESSFLVEDEAHTSHRNRYSCFGGSGLAVKSRFGRHSAKQTIQTVACH